jgi:GT2 family glycosyltransferase
MGRESNKIVSVIVVTIGVGNHLKECLDSLKAQTYPDREIIIIDNSTRADLGRELAGADPQIKLYSSRVNLFYCQALNKGIEMGGGEFILCLNDDIILDRDFIKEGLKGFSLDSRVGSVSGKILRSDGKTIDSTGLFLSALRTAKERGYGQRDKGGYEAEGYIFGVSGACAFYRKEMLEDIKEGGYYFDPAFRLFYEDLDVAWRAKRSGWKGYYVPTAVSYHVRGLSVRNGKGLGRPLARRYLSDELQLYLIRNRYLCLAKNETLFSFLVHLPFIALYDFVIWSYVLLFRPRVIKNFLADLMFSKNPPN